VVTAVMPTARRRVPMATMITRLTLARPTDIGDLITSLTACSSESDLGTAGASGVASVIVDSLTGDLMAAASMGEASMVGASTAGASTAGASTAGASTAGASMAEGSPTAGASERRADADLAAGVVAGTSNHVVVAVASTVVVAADSTAAVAADSTVVAGMVVEGIAKT
jgi:trimeric autotransporter adhesin